jgi:uncharacterized protein
MRPSLHNILITTRTTRQTYIINLLTGHADHLDPEEAARFRLGNPDSPAEWIEKGYLAEEATEEALYRNKYLDFLDQREKDEVQLFFIPGYRCNFSCSYCYQSGFHNPSESLTPEVSDAFFNYIRDHFGNRRKYITLFGGEPLLNSPAHLESIRYVASLCMQNEIPLAVVTNGFHLTEYLDIFQQNTIREIQVTLDGTAATHNARRRLKNGAPTFERIVSGIDKTLALNLPVNLRMVLDRDNISDLPGLAAFSIQKGWTNHPLFKTQLGRNYELHYCQDIPDKLLTRVELWEQVYHLSKKHPGILEFHKPAYSVAGFLARQGELPSPLFDSCPGCKTEWAFDYTGRIYSCTATAGKTEESLGTFYPCVTLSHSDVAQWENRDVLSIPECKTCNLQLACGGGCASVARNRTGRLNAPDCRPVKELLELGMEHYFPVE